MDFNELEKLYAETFHGIEPGTIITGKVVVIKPDSVIVDVGYKADGVVSKEEFSPAELGTLKPGDPVEVYVERMMDSEGVLLLSKERASKVKAWDTIETSLRENLPLEGVITGKTKGGLFVDISGVRAFLPASHIDLKPVRDLEPFVGLRANFKILKLNRQSNVIVSRKAFMEEERQGMRAKTLTELREGALMKGTVKNITDYGAFVDLGGIDGLLHISDISWGRIAHPAEHFKVGDEIEVVVLKYDAETGKVTLGYKQKRPDPWSAADEKYPQGSKVNGRVSSIMDYGAFIEVEEGLEGLVHVSEMDWSPRPKHPSKHLSPGEAVEALVLKVDKAERRLSLSIRRLKPSPWQLVAERYKAGQVITGKVRGLTDFGAFIGLPEGVDGLLHISDISWTRHIKHPSELLKKGQKVDAVILNVDPDKEKIALGMRQLRPDPWLGEITQRFRLGEELPCKVLKRTDFGLFALLDSEVEGLVYASEVSEKVPINEGDEIWCRIIKVDAENRKIGLSMKNVRGDQ